MFAATAALLLVLAPTDDEKAIRAVLDAQIAAWNKGDLDGFMAGYWNSEKLFFISGSKTTQGWKATKERYEKAYKGEGKEMGQLAFGELNVESISPDAALVRGRFDLKLSKEDTGGRFTLLVKKMPDGWKITHDHTSK